MGVEKRKRFLINAAYIAVIALLVFVVLHYLLPMVAPFAIAAVVAWMLHRPIRFLEENTELPPKRCAIFMVVLFYGTIGVLIFVAGTHLFSGLATLVGSITTLYEAHGQPFFADILANVENILMRLDPSLVAALDSLGTDVLGSLRQMIYNLSVTAMGVITGFAYSIPGLFIKLVLMIISTLFIAIDYRRLTGFCLRQMDERTQNLFIQVKEYVVGTLLVTPMVAYSIAMVPWKGAKVIFPIILATMMIPGQVTQIPMYITWSKLGFINTYVPLILPYFVGTPYYIYLMRQFMKSIP